MHRGHDLDLSRICCCTTNCTRKIEVMEFGLNSGAG